jgi:FSR family fosmidomycin resistance protein-like MFS transporter
VPESAVQARNDEVAAGKKWRVLFAGCLAHITHDGFTDMLYVFFPIWQQTFLLSFFQIGLLKSAFSGTMSLLQMPAGILARRMGILKVLCLGTLLTGAAVIALGFAGSPLVLGALLILGGMGSSTQHPLASSAISSAYQGKASRVALSTYNFSGDIGKLIIPASAALLIAYAGWRWTLHLLGVFGFLAAAAILLGLLHIPLASVTGKKTVAGAKKGGLFGAGSLPFAALSAIGVIDSATRMGFLTYLPFLLRDKGATVPTIGLALSLLFAGGAMGKFVCGVAATRVGILASVVVTELATAACIIGMLGLSLKPALLLCPLLGIALNGTSSVLYGTVPELVPEDRRNEAFAFFYTCTIGAGGISPLIYGVIGDFAGIKIALVVVALMVLATIPLTLPLRGKLQDAG